MTKYYCFRVLLITMSWKKQYVANSEPKVKDDELFRSDVVKLDNGIYETSNYVKFPLAKYLCLEESKYREYYSRAREELKKKGFKPTRTTIIEYMIRMILDKYKKGDKP